MDAEGVKELIESTGIKIVDLKFTDLPGQWQHFSIPAKELTDYSDFDTSIWVDGIGFDGSSIRGFQQIQESDMILIPDPSTAFVDPIAQIPTLSLVCDIYDPVTRQPYTRDPRYVARKAEAHLKSTGIADISYWGPELEFFIFDSIRFHSGMNESYVYVDSEEGIWNSGKEGSNLGYKPREKEGYFPVPPTDSLQDLRSEIILEMMASGIDVEVHHHEVATAGQCEIDMHFDSLVSMADKVLKYKYLVKNVARRHGKVATFMPKPLFGDNGSGMHTHQSLWVGNTNLMYDPNGYALLSELARNYIGGLLRHGRALMALCAPTTNSYKRLVPGYEAPVNLVYSARNRSAAARIPMYSSQPRARRIEFRSPDPTCNPYLAFSAMLLAGLDGVKKGIDPGPPFEMNTYEVERSAELEIPTVPSSLAEALDALEQDHEFLLEGGVFTEDLLQTWLDYKREHELDPVRLRPHPYEYHLYFDA